MILIVTTGIFEERPDSMLNDMNNGYITGLFKWMTGICDETTGLFQSMTGICATVTGIYNE